MAGIYLRGRDPNQSIFHDLLKNCCLNWYDMRVFVYFLKWAQLASDHVRFTSYDKFCAKILGKSGGRQNGPKWPKNWPKRYEICVFCIFEPQAIIT